MFKRVLVLVLFLFGVFWWLTSRDNDESAEPKNDTVAEETATEAEGSDEDDDEEGDDEDESEDDATEVTTTPEATTTAVVTSPTTTPVVTSSTTTSAPATTTTPTTTTPSPVTPAPVVARPSVPDRVTDVKVYMYEWNIDLSDKTIPAGTVNFTVQNDGRFTHDFSLSGLGNLGKVMPSETKTFTLKVRAGEYEVFSKRRQDYERGMTDNFVVTP